MSIIETAQQAIKTYGVNPQSAVYLALDAKRMLDAKPDANWQERDAVKSALTYCRLA